MVIFINFCVPALTSSKESIIIINLTRWLFHNGKTKDYPEQLQWDFRIGFDPGYEMFKLPIEHGMDIVRWPFHKFLLWSWHCGFWPLEVGWLKHPNNSIVGGYYILVIGKDNSTVISLGGKTQQWTGSHYDHISIHQWYLWRGNQVKLLTSHLLQKRFGYLLVNALQFMK